MISPSQTRFIEFIFLKPPYLQRYADSQTEKGPPLLKGTVMKIVKALINDSLRVSKVSLKLRIPNIYSFAVIYPRMLLIS